MCNCKHNHTLGQTLGRSAELDASLKKEQDNAKKGFLCEFHDDADGSLKKVFNIEAYLTLFPSNTHKECPKTVHENLWEQGYLNMNIGLFRVNDINDVNMKHDGNGKYPVNVGDVFQIRGHDLANMTILYTGSGWIVMDVLTSSQTAEYAWTNLVQKHLNEDPIVAVIYSHSHIDHYAGIGGLKKFFKPSGIIILAPEGFTKHVVSENIYVGTAMKRRAVYQYGNSLTVDEKGQVDAGLGKAVSSGTDTLLVPTVEIGFGDYQEGQNFCEKIIDGITLHLQFTPDTEAPAEMNVYLPDQKVLFIAENCAGTLHNLLTPRGAQVRDALAWAGFLDQTLVTFSDMEYVCSAHNWPHFTQADAVRFIEIQRDLYRYIHNATLHLVNLGYTIDEVGRMIAGEGDDALPIPADFANEWCCHGFYGTFNHDAKAVYQRYIGWYDGNPAHLNKHKTADRANRYVDAFGVGVIVMQAEKALGAKDYAWAAELYDIILNADAAKFPDHFDIVAVKSSYADALKNMGYQSEAATWRNMYLTGALEVYPPIQPNPTPTPDNRTPAKYLQFSDDTINAMTLEMILQYFGIMFSGSTYDAAKQAVRTMTFEVTSQTSSGTTTEYATAKAARGVLDYRILSKLDAYPKSTPNFTFKGEKTDIFRAFTEHDTAKLKNILASGSYNDAILFVTNYFSRFRMDFPIMTPRPQSKTTKLLTQVTIYWGSIVDFLQVTFSTDETYSAGSPWTLPNKKEIDTKNDPIVKITGICFVNYAMQTAISQLRFHTKGGVVYGPYGERNDGTSFAFEQEACIINGFYGAFSSGGRQDPTSSERDQYMTQFGVYFVNENAPTDVVAMPVEGDAYTGCNKFDFKP